MSLLVFRASNFKTPETFPVPKGIKNMLFYVQRSINVNTIVYELNTNQLGEINKDEPIKFYWVNYSGASDIEPLNYIQKKYAYGLEVKLLDTEKLNYCFNFVSYKKQILYLINTGDKHYKVYSNFNGKMIIVNRIYVHIEGGGFWTPKIKYIEVQAIDPQNNEMLNEKIVP